MSKGNSPDFSYDIGYSGVVRIAASQVLATGGNMSVQYTPLYTSGVWGAGWFNATEKIAYAPNYITMSSSVNYQLTYGITSTLQTWAFTSRNNPEDYQILPNGVAGYSGTAYCVGCSFSASQDSIVSGDISLKTGDVQGTITTGKSDGTGAGKIDDFSAGYLDVYPFWASSVKFGQAGDSTDRTEPGQVKPTDSQNLDVLDWNASYSSDLVFVMTCCGKTDDLSGSGGVLAAQYCCLGTMEATGSLTIFKVSSELQPDNFRAARACIINFAKSNGTEPCTISFSKIILDSGSVDIQTGTSLIQSSFNFTALGTGTSAPMSFSSGGSGGGAGGGSGGGAGGGSGGGAGGGGDGGAGGGGE